MSTKGTHGSALKSKNKSEGTTAELIDISRPGNDENIILRDSVPVVKLYKINSPCRLKVISSSDTQRWTTPDEEARATAEILQTLNKQQPGSCPPSVLNTINTPW